MHSHEDDLLLVTEVAEQYGVSVRTVERWVEQGLPAQKATNEQLLALLAQKRLKGWPPKGVWVIAGESAPG
jgi:phage terminase Nu1 subunit (DNA packaging protein)